MKTTLAASIALATFLILPQPLAAAIIVVDDNCTLADAMTAANSDAAAGLCPAGAGGDEISLQEDVNLAVVDNTTNGPNGLPSVTSTIEIQGNGFAIRRDTSAPAFRIFHVASGGDLTLQNTAVSNGVSLYPGGGIYNNFGGTVILSNSTLSGNSAVESGGGIYNFFGTAYLTNSTLAGNSTGTYGGGIYNLGTAHFTNSTLSGNSGVSSGGSGIDTTGAVTLTNTTLSGNTGGPALYLFSQGAATLTNSLLANSTGGNCNTTVTDNGNNLADDSSCGTISGTLTGLDTELSDNGGPTRTHALLAPSNAIDSGSAPDCPATDQRGAGRESTCDIGSFEFIACPDLVLSEHTVVSTEAKFTCQNIVVGPDFTVAGFGDLTLWAGRSIAIGNGTSVESNGRASIEIAPYLQLNPRTVFLTSTTYDGNLGGLAGADTKCNARATAAGLPGSFKAWLSIPSCGPANPCRSFTQSPTPYIRVDGLRVADDWTDLTDGTLQAPLLVDEFGDIVPPTWFVWSNTRVDGTPSTLLSHCGSWEATTGTGAFGDAESSNHAWTHAGTSTCERPLRRLYCFEM